MSKKLNNIMGIYKITNKINNKIYIGSSKDITKRWQYHINDLMYNRHHSYKLQKDFNEFGLNAFVFEIIQIVEDKNKLLDIEQDFMDKTQCWLNEIGYNVSISSKERKTLLQSQIELNNIKKENNNPLIMKPIVKKEKVRNPFLDSDNEIIRVIANQDVEYLKNKINYKETYYDIEDDCFNEIFQYDFSWFFDNPICIFCGENNFEIKKGYKNNNIIYTYNCKCHHTGYNLLHIIELIGGYKSRYSSIKFLFNLFNMSFDKHITKEFNDKKIREYRDSEEKRLAEGRAKREAKKLKKEQNKNSKI